MARLPTVESFGARPTPRSSRGVVSFRADIAQTAEADGLRREAANIGDMGKIAGDFLEGINRQKLAKSRSDFLSGKIELDSKFAQDQDFETAETRYAAELKKLREQTGQGLFGDARATFDSQTSLDSARGLAAIKIDAFGKMKNHNLATLAGTLDTNRNALLKSRDPGTRESLLRATMDSIKSMREQGFLTETDAAKMGREFTQDYAGSFVQMQTPEEQHRVLGVPEGWSPGDDLPPRAKNGSLVDFIPEDLRVKLARNAMPGVNAKVAQSESDRIIDEGGDIASQIEKARAITNPTVRDEVERRLKQEYAFTETLKKEHVVEASQEESDRIAASGLGLAGQLSAAREIDDPDIRDATVNRITALHNQNKAVDAERLKGLKTDAVALARKGEFDEIAPEVVAELGGTMAGTLQKISAQVSRGASDFTSPKVENELNRMSPEDLAKVDLMDPKYLGGLSESRWQTWSDRQGAISRGKDPAASTAQRTRSQIVTQDLKAAGLDGNEKAVALFNRRMDEEVSALETETGKKAGAKDIQSISDRLLISGEVKGSVIDPDKRFFQAEPGEEFFISDTDEIPTAHVEGFRAALERHLKRKPTDDELVTEYNGYLNRGR